MKLAGYGRGSGASWPRICKKNFLYVPRIYTNELGNITKAIGDRRITIIDGESAGSFLRAAEDTADA